MPLAKKRKFWNWVALAAALLSLFIASRFLPFGQWIQSFTHWIKNLGGAGYFIFLAGYIIGTVLFVPGALLTIAAGIAFGLFWGTILAAVSATIGAACAFLIARYFARSSVERRAAQNEKFKAIDTAIGEHGWKIVILLRLSPLVPFNLSNYVYGLTKIRFWPYVLASFIGMFPGTLLYVYLGYIGQATLGGGKRERSPQEYLFLAIGLAATIALTVYFTRLAKKTLQFHQTNQAR